MSLHFVIFFNFEAALKEGLQKRLKFSKFFGAHFPQIEKKTYFSIK